MVRGHPKGGGGWLPGCSCSKSPKIDIKSPDFVDTISNVLRDFAFSRNQPKKSLIISKLELRKIRKENKKNKNKNVGHGD
jgi:hypothetical protein